MHYTSISLKNYRSYEEESVEFADGVNIIVGPNASGKTNLLEATQVISQGSSFRAKDQALIKEGKEWLRIEATTNENSRRVMVVKNENSKVSKEIKIDDNQIKKLTQNKKIPVVLFEPNHLNMISGSPEKRRDYLDTILSQTTVDYKTTLRKYKKALSQRNRLLKTRPNLMPDDVFVWDVQVSEYGAKIFEARRSLVALIDKTAQTNYREIAKNKPTLKVEYEPSVTTEDYASFALRRLQNNLPDDKMKGFTSVGPHREDLKFTLNNKEASTSASRGESRSIVLVLKTLEIELLHDAYVQKPIILLDDVFSELDGARRLALTQKLSDHQTIITTTDADTITKDFAQGFNIIALG